MAIHFSAERQQQVRAAHMRWWAGTLDRPLVKVTIPDAYPRPHTSNAPILCQRNCTDFSYSPEALIDAIDDSLSAIEFMGDSYPSVSFDTFGPGVLAAMCGARLDNSSGGVWFSVDEPLALDEIHVHYDPDNIWSRRIKDIYRAGLRKWNGLVTLGMPDLGGVLDVAATFRGSENLLMDLYDSPDEVLRLRTEVETAWHQAYADFMSVLMPVNGGITDWAGIFSAEPAYVLQCDFSYMISRDMFVKFVLPTLQRDCDRFANTLYHLDGVGELNHLDDLLKIERLNAVQWVYGDGQPSARHWPEVYSKIHAAGKRVYLAGDADDFDAISKIVPSGLYYGTAFPNSERSKAEELLKKARHTDAL